MKHRKAAPFSGFYLFKARELFLLGAHGSAGKPERLWRGVRTKAGGELETSGVVHIDDVGVAETWRRLSDDPKAVLVDVRTQAEWAFVGLPDLASIAKRVVTQEWQTFPQGQVDVQFAERLSALLARQGVGREDEIFFICRSGSRSRMAAAALSEHGFRRCRNVAEGFEGPLDSDRHRGQVAGWKAAGLPWIQG